MLQRIKDYIVSAEDPTLARLDMIMLGLVLAICVMFGICELLGAG